MASRILVRSFPDRPTKGMPCLSSSAPGPSPMSMMEGDGFPFPGTVLVRSWHNPHFLHRWICLASDSRVVALIVFAFMLGFVWGTIVPTSC